MHQYSSFDELQTADISKSIQPGTVLTLLCKFTRPEKLKLCVVGHWNDKPLLLVINSGVHPWIARNKDLCGCQLKITKQQEPFLNKDHSYINCGEIIDCMTRDEIIAEIKEMKRKNILGILTQKTKKNIVDIISCVDTRTVSPAHKQIISDSLS